MSDVLFEMSTTAHAWGPLQFSPYPNRKGAARPTHLSRIPSGTDIATGIKGAEMLGLPLLPQGERIAAVMEAVAKDRTPKYPTVGILVPRRGTKTTSIWSVLLGRCWSRPGHMVVTTAQDGIRARNRFREVLRALDRMDFQGDRSATNRRGKLRWSNGDESIEFDKGSRIWVVPPEPGAFRGEAADDMLFDEAGELSVAQSEDLAAGALPLMDTRPMGQVIIAGTPGKVRAGLLWQTLQQGRRGDKLVGIVDYSIRDDEPSVIYPDGDDRAPQLNEVVLRRVHPGIGTLTTIAKMRDRFGKMPLVQFEREYLCRFPFDASVSAINPAHWNACRALLEDGTAAALPPRPARIGLAYDVEPDGSAAAVCAAWRDPEGRPHVEVLAFRPGVTWLPTLVQTAAQKHRVPVGYDTIGANTNPADHLHRMRLRLSPLNLRHVQGAAQRITTEIESGSLRHYGQPDLDRAVEGANWRTVAESGRLFGRKVSAHPVAPLVAASLALWVHDQTRERTPKTVVTSA